MQLQAWLPGRVLRGHGERIHEPAADPERAGHHHRPAGFLLHLCQAEAETETAAQVTFTHTDWKPGVLLTHFVEGLLLPRTFRSQII